MAVPPADAAVPVLGGLPDGLRQELLDEFNKIERNYREAKWEPAELDAGRLCEVVYCIVRGHVDGSFPAQASKPPKMDAACSYLQNLPAADWPRSIRLHIPRVILALYGIRNDRDAGHVGAEVDSNEMDAALALAMSKWLVAELVRIFHQVDTATAAAYVNSLIQRESQAVWNVAGRKRALKPGLSMKDKTLLFLHSTPHPVTARELFKWTDHSNWTVYGAYVLAPLEAENLLWWERETDLVHLSPLGVRYAEARLPSWMP